MKSILVRLYALVTLCCAPVNLYALDELLPSRSKLDIRPTDVIIWEAVQAIQGQDGQLLVGLRLSTKDNFSIYKEKLEFSAPPEYTIVDQIGPPSRQQEDPIEGGKIEVYDGGDFELKLKSQQNSSAKDITLAISFLGCTHLICLMPYTQNIKIPIYYAEDSAQAQVPPSLEDLTEEQDQPTPSRIEATHSSSLSYEEKFAEQLKAGQLSWTLVLLIIFVGGIATNLTPCVFPMIPITLRLLAQQGQTKLTSTLFYALGIIVSYTSLGLLATLSGGIFGSLMASPWLNFAFGLLFISLGITMLGYGNLSKLQSLGLQLGAGRSSYLNAFGMGAGAGLVAAPCTGPIMAALLAYATSLHSLSQSTGLFLLYSSGFALPYIFLGLAAKRVVAYKVRPQIQVAIKILFAASMFGLALFYLKNPAHEFLPIIRGQWHSIFIGCLLGSLPVLAYIIFHPRLIVQKNMQLAPTILLGIGLFAGVLWATGHDVSSELRWYKSEADAYAEAARTQKPLLIDGYADWCVACKKMDQTTFAHPDVISELQKHWILIKLDLTESNEITDALAQKYEMQGLPTLILVPSHGDLKQGKKIAGYMASDRLLTELRLFRGQ